MQTGGWERRLGPEVGRAPKASVREPRLKRVWGVGTRRSVPLGSSPPPGLSRFGAPPASSQLTRGAGELSGTPRPASLGCGGRAAIGQLAGPLGPPRSSDIRKR